MATSQAYAVGRVRVLVRGLLGRAGLERLLAARTPQEFCRMLGEMGWGDASKQREVEELAERHVRDASELMAEAASDRRVTDCFGYRYDAHNLKLLIKAQALGRIGEADSLPLMHGGTVSADDAVKAVRDGHFDAFAPELKQTAEELIGETAVKVDPLAIDARLDQATYRQIERNLRHGAPREIRDYFVAQVDLTNLLIRLRVRAMGRTGEFARKLMLPGGKVNIEKLAAAESIADLRELYDGKDYWPRLRRALEESEQTGDLTPVEKLRDDYLKDMIEKHRYEPLSMLPLVGYMIAREREAAAVRMIMTALINRFPVDKLRERLRDMYGN